MSPMSDVDQPEMHNLHGWLQELCDATAPERLDVLAKLLLIQPTKDSKAEAREHILRFQALYRHVLNTYDVNGEEWQLALRDMEQTFSDADLAAYVDRAPTLDEDICNLLRDVAAKMGGAYFLTLSRLAVLDDAHALESSPGIREVLDRQPTVLSEPEEKRRAA